MFTYPFRLNFFTRLLKKRVAILVVGLDGSGKSSILSFLKNGVQHIGSQLPTLGMDVVKFSRSKTQFLALDMSGQGNGRSLWKSCCKDCLGLVVVVDATDKDRLDVLKTELNLLLQSMRSNIPILFLANKIDISDGLSVGDCVVGLSLDHIKANHKIFPTSAISGAGIEEAFSWLRYAIVKSSISKVKNSVAKITHP